MDQGFHDEVAAVHDFLTGWLNGSVPREAAVFAGFAAALDPGFTLISPSGEVAAHADILASIEQGHGSRGDATEPFRIWIERPLVRERMHAHLLGSYEEWHRLRGATTARITTVLFRRDSGRPSGLRWLHVHETWLPGHAPPADQAPG